MKKQLLVFGALASIAFGSCKSGDDNNQTVTPPTGTKIVQITGDIKANRTFSADSIYVLNGFVYVTDGATLSIKAGTIVMGDKATKGTLVITRGAKIDAQGTASNPIVFTSEQDPGARREGDWGGIIMLGKAKINPSGGEAKIEGGLTPTGGGDEKKYIFYGGSDDADNSGILKYARIEFAGIAYTPDNEINGLTMGGVGNGTTISYVQVYRSGDDAFEWFGGSVNCDHLVASYTWDDDFDTDFGFSGKVQFGLAHRVKTIADQSGSNGFESDNDGSGSTNSPKTSAHFSNMTIVGPIQTANPASSPTSGLNANYQHGAQIRRNSAMSLYNSIIMGWPIGLYIDDTRGAATSANITSGALQFKNNILAGNAVVTKGTWTGLAAWYAATGTTQLDSAQKVMLADPFKFSGAVASPAGNPSFLLKSGSPAASGADFAGLPAGFQQVSYRGAFDGSNDWTQGWINYAAEETVYKK